MDPALEQLANLLGVDCGYHDVHGNWHVPKDPILCQVLSLLGADLVGHSDGQKALDLERKKRAARLLEPCTVLWSEEESRVELSLPASAAGSVRWLMSWEQGGADRGERSIAELPACPEQPSGSEYRRCWLALPAPPSHGYHRLSVETDFASGSSVVLAAPEAAYAGPGTMRTWGLFAPTYALRTCDDRGVGDLGSLRALGQMATAWGASFVGTLPLVAATAGEASPYSPCSKLFWNELYLDLRWQALARLGLPGLAEHAQPEAVKPGRDSAEKLLDYPLAFARLREQFEPVVAALWADAAVCRDILDWARDHGTVHSYACFRAYEEVQGSWQDWPADQRAGQLGLEHVDEQRYRYHLCAQWLLHRQLTDLAASCPAALYLDLPVGVAPNSFDAWFYASLFADDFSVGAPPDPLCADGQYWGLPPLHPHRSRADGHRYFRESIAAHMRFAGMLRIDHVMGLHRLFWVENGKLPAEGLYVRYPADELYAIVCIESHRHQCAVVGEDLGTVPDYVRPAMQKRGVHGMFVGQFDWSWRDGQPEVHGAPEGAVACLGTHDTRTFFQAAKAEGFGDRAQEVLDRWHEDLARGPADAVVVTLEDLWLEAEPQNLPGSTSSENPNWRRRFPRDLQALSEDPEVEKSLHRVQLARKNGLQTG